MWQANYGKVKENYFTMGTPIVGLAGAIVGNNLARPSVRPFQRYLKINKDLGDIYTYNTLLGTSTPVNVAFS